METSSLKALLKPRSIGILGASQRNQRGARVIRNLVDLGFAGGIYPINPHYDEVAGARCYPRVSDVPEVVDCVLVLVPAEHVPAALEEAFAAGTRGAVILSSGFAEAGEEGRERQRALERLAAQGLAICGPNCYGILNLTDRAAVFSADLPDPFLPGHVALVSQSGSFSTLIAWPLMEQRGVGFSYVISCGNQAGVYVEDYLDYLVDDPGTEVIGAFVESFQQPRKLRAVAAKAASRGKPIVVMKTGRSQKAQQATLAHTGALAGSGETVAALLRQIGVVQVETLPDLMETLVVFALAGRRRASWQVGAVAGSGGECGHLCDVAADNGLILPDLQPATEETICRLLPDFGRPRNPVDGTGAMFADAQIFPGLLGALSADSGMDVLLAEFKAAAAKGERPGFRAFAEATAQVAARSPKLVVAYSASFLGQLDPESMATLKSAGVPYLQGTEAALRAVSGFVRWRESLASSPGSPGSDQPDSAPRLSLDGPSLRQATSSGVLSFPEAAALLTQVGIPVVASQLVGSPAEAVQAADEMGYPVVLKIESPTIVHKSDVGGVVLGCPDAGAVYSSAENMLRLVRERLPQAPIRGILVQPMVGSGVETILGVKNDPVYGPVVLVGLGGLYAEILRDVSLRLPPLRRKDAEEMLAELHGAALLDGVRGGPPLDRDALVQAILSAGLLAERLADRLVALEVNPLLLRPLGQGVLALDALVDLT